MRTVSFLLTKKAIDAYHRITGVELTKERIINEFSSFYLKANLIVTKNALFIFETNGDHDIITYCAPKKPGRFRLTRSPIIKNRVSVRDCNGSKNKLIFLTPLNIQTPS